MNLNNLQIFNAQTDFLGNVNCPWGVQVSTCVSYVIFRLQHSAASMGPPPSIDFSNVFRISGKRFASVDGPVNMVLSKGKQQTFERETNDIFTHLQTLEVRLVEPPVLPIQCVQGVCTIDTDIVKMGLYVFICKINPTIRLYQLNFVDVCLKTPSAHMTKHTDSVAILNGPNCCTAPSWKKGNLPFSSMNTLQNEILI